MGNGTQVTTFALGGAVVSLLLGTLAAFGVEADFPPGYEGAATVVVASVIAWVLPESLRTKLPTKPDTKI